MTTPSDTRKTVLITGAGIGGIGGELAKQFHLAGYRVFAAARRLDTVTSLQSTYGIEPIYLDVTLPATIATALSTVSALTSGTLDVLVNNAGQGAPLPALDLAIESTVKDIYDVNVFGVMRMVQAFAPLLIAAQGTIVNIGSIAPLVPLVFGSAYSSSKAAVHAYSDCLRIEMKPFGVRVLVVVTGGVKSGIVRPGMEVLPENSLYTPIREFYIKRVVVSQGTESMETETYAKGVVARVVSGSAKPLLWWGYFAWGAWALQTFTWKGFTDYFLARKFGLDKLAVLVREQREKAKLA